MSETDHEPRPQVEYAVSVLTSHNPALEAEIEKINKAHWYTQKSPNQATQTGFTIPGEYGGDIQSRIDKSLQPDSKTKFLVLTAPDGRVIGYREIELHPKGENPDEFRNVYTDPEAARAINSPHMEGRESAFDPEWRTLKDTQGKKPSEVMLEYTENYCHQLGYPYLWIWIIGHRGPNIPNKASWKFFTRHGYKPALTAEGDIPETRAAGLFKKI